VESLPIPVLVVLAAVAVAAATDLRSFKIHNALTLPLLACGLVYHAVVDGSAGLAGSALGAVVGFGLFFFVFLLGGMGGGDVKLMAGVGAWLGVPAALAVAAVASLAAGAYALVVIATSGRARETRLHLAILFHRLAAVGRHLVAEDNVEAAVGRGDRRARLIPFGAMVGVALITLIVISQWRLLS
jgi:Flp pilus assembly protein protease CpaA